MNCSMCRLLLMPEKNPAWKQIETFICFCLCVFDLLLKKTKPFFETLSVYFTKHFWHMLAYSCVQTINIKHKNDMYINYYFFILQKPSSNHVNLKYINHWPVVRVGSICLCLSKNDGWWKRSWGHKASYKKNMTFQKASIKILLL